MFAQFSSSGTRLATGDSNGYCVYGLPPEVDSFQLLFNEAVGRLSIVSLLDGTPLIAVVSSTGDAPQQGASRVLFLYNAVTHELLATLHFDTAILGVQLNVCRLVVILEKYIHLFDLNTLTPLQLIRTAHPPNTLGIASLSEVSPAGACFLAFPLSESTLKQGDVLVYNAIELRSAVMIEAHRTPIAALECCCQGGKMVTVSVTGSKIKVFSLHSGSLLCVLRRGHRSAEVTTLAVSSDGALVAMGSNLGTLHVFRTADRPMEETRSFAKVKLADPSHSICKFSVEGTQLNIAVLPSLTEKRPMQSDSFVTQYAVGSNTLKLSSKFLLRAAQR